MLGALFVVFVGVAEQAQVPEAFGLCRQTQQGEIAELGEAQLVILVGEQGCDLGQGGRRGGVLGMDRVDAAEVDIGEDAQHQVVHLVEAVTGKGQVAAPAEIIEGCAVDGGQLFGCVLFHIDLLAYGICSIPYFARGHNGQRGKKCWRKMFTVAALTMGDFYCIIN